MGTAVINQDFMNSFNALKDPEIAQSWEDFMKFVKDFRTHMFFGAIAVTGIGLFTTVYSLINSNKSKVMVGLGIAGLATTLIGTGMTVDMASHLYYG